ncbi:hypothetical protein RND81_13G142600 [Saponaria officinalis]|uniref:PHD-type domain-containing protein n=1 Tax=Saponaria officinalis TaxID=3572 RepID=A0AAW1H0L3_SAPOF
MVNTEDSRVDLGHSDSNSRVVNIPDLNLNDEHDAGSIEEGVGEPSEVRRSGGEENSSMCEVKVSVDECKGMEVENEERVKVSMNNGDGILGQISEVNEGGKDVIAEKLNGVVGLANSELLLKSESRENGMDVKKSLENDKRESICEDEESGEYFEGETDIGETSPCLKGDAVGDVDVSEDHRKTKACDSAEMKESREKRSVIDEAEVEVDEVDESRKVKKEAKAGIVHVLGKVLRSRVVPAKGLGEAAGGRQIRASPHKRKQETDSPRNFAATMNDVGSISSRVRSSGRRKRAIDLSDGEVVELNNVQQECKVEDDDENDTSVRSSQKKKRGRPKRSIDHPKDESVHVLQPQLDDRSTRKTKDRHREQVSVSCSKEDGAVVCKGENKAGKVSKKSVGSLTPRRKSERAKRVVDYCEKEAVRRNTFFGCKIDFPPEEEKEGVSNVIVASSKKKGKRGRPRKQEGNGLVKTVSYDSGVSDAEKIKASPITPTIRQRRQEIDHHEKATDALPTVEEKSSTKEEISEGVQVQTSSKSKEDVLTDNNLPVKLNKREIAETRAAEKNLIRNQIVDMLKHAGWTIEFRPRQGREYNDAVYMNPEGKTHWSVTKAYFSLLKEIEERKTGSIPANTNVSFTPLPDEALSKLFRVVSKTRSDKNKKKKRKRDGDSFDEELTKDEKGSKTGKKSKQSGLKRKPSARDGTQSKRRCALVARRSKGLNLESVEAKAYSGKHSVLAWLIDSGVVSRDGKVLYMNRRKTKTLLEGNITRDGICCHCCKVVFSVFEFEKHSGSKPDQPYENLFLESGQSLLHCLLESWNKQDAAILKGFHSVNVDTDDPNDDTCAICGDGGDLMCCDGCPSTFHNDCVDLEDVPSGEWHCVYCSCKFCGEAETETTDSLDTAFSLISCSLCDQKFHRSCFHEENDAEVKSEKASFCGKNCEQIFEHLEPLIGTKSDLGDGFSWTILQRFDVKADADSLEAQKIENNSKLAVALSVMDECFVPIIDPRSGVNLISHVVYNSGSNFRRLDFRSFFTIILEKGDEVISAASIRIHGKQLAEMPFIGTRHIYRRQGMCRRLLTGIEQVLASLDIENLVIPAIPTLLNTWTSVFGFQPLEESTREEMKSMSMLVFAHTDMLQKPLLRQHLVVEGIARTENDGNALKSSNKQINSMAEKSEVDDGLFDLNVEASGIPESSLNDTDKVETLPSPMEISDNKASEGCLNLNHPKASSDDKPSHLMNMLEYINSSHATPADPGKGEDGPSQPNGPATDTSDIHELETCAEVSSESSCNTGSAVAENTTAAVFLAAGAP